MKELAKIRNDVVGSLLRPAPLKQARVGYDEGKISLEELRQTEDRHIRDAVKLQEEIGLSVVTDGEYRRLNFQDSFGESVAGFDAGKPTLSFYEKRVEGGSPLQRWEIPDQGEQKGTAVAQRRPVARKISLARNLPMEEFRYLQRVAHKPGKVALIGPDRISQRFDWQNSKPIYSGLDEFVADVVKVEREIIRGLVDAGCRYVQIDAPGYTAYVDPPSLAAMRARGEDPKENFSRSLKADNAMLAGYDDVTFGIHLCRGNQRSMWHREGSYDDIAERLLNELNYDRFLFEYDTPRAGGFAPLRFLPQGKVIVLGLVSTKVPQLESIDELKRRIEQAAKFAPLDQIAISPQCGFSSDVVGNLISDDEQKRKLELVVETARQVWG
ncbi:MAG: methionine synthase vitamin-B12 independent [Deltaproteobacteria bacterium]|nr:methionine synthase vitamin-B12 independent [Deltaproteobacteria bacterium]